MSLSRNIKLESIKERNWKPTKVKSGDSVGADPAGQRSPQ